MTALREGVAAALIVIGLLVMTVSVIGMARLPDLYTRLHSASKSVVLGVLSLLLASIGTDSGAMMARAGLVGAFLLLTAPVSAHAIAHAAYHVGDGGDRGDDGNGNGHERSERGDRGDGG